MRTSTAGRRRTFADAAWARLVVSQLWQSADSAGFEVFAYCVMPDHVHVLLSALRADSDLTRWVSRWKQTTGYAYARAVGLALWQCGYFERTLRREDDTGVVAAYILGNPVRAGLATQVGEYPYAWARE